jgi:hypothetical protein
MRPPTACLILDRTSTTPMRYIGSNLWLMAGPPCSTLSIYLPKVRRPGVPTTVPAAHTSAVGATCVHGMECARQDGAR